MLSLNDIWVVLLGLIAGWVINYLSDVLPIHRKLVKPFCLDCQHEKSWFEQLLLRSCVHCGKPIHIRHWVVMVASIAASLALWHYPNQRLGYGVGLFLLVYLGVVFVIDLEYRLILFPVSIFGAVFGLAIGFSFHGLWMTLLGGAAGFGAMLALYYLGDLFARFIARMRGQTLEEVALGFGDVTLSGVLGLILGWPGITAGLILAILLGGVVSIFYILSRVITRSYQPFTAIPYAPFLILGAVFLLFRT